MFKKLSFIALLVLPILVMATHYRAGEISYRHVSGFTYEITVVTYTKLSSVDADSDTISVHWGDGSRSTLWRISPTDIGSADLRRNVFIDQHTYSGPASYTIWVEDQNRNGGIVNIPDSEQVPFYVESTLLISPQEFGHNNSPILTYPPIDIAAVEEVFIHNTGAYDPDGDSLGYDLIIPKGLNGLNIPGYAYPDEFPVSPDNQVEIDPKTGDIIWTVPQNEGQFNIAIQITEYRNGLIIGSMMRDMQVTVVSTSNTTPSIEDLQDTCLIAGTALNQDIVAFDANGDELQIYASGGPFESNEPIAEFLSPTFIFQDTFISNFSWQTHCFHVRKSPYMANFRAIDDHFRPLVDIESWLITVTGSSPSQLTATPEGKRIEVQWDSNYMCKIHDHFEGYRLWRKEGSTESIMSNCPVDLRDYGYEAIADLDSNIYIDSNINYGSVYCYRVQAIYRDGSDAFPFNEVLSKASQVACSNLAIDLPIPINVDVLETSTDSGSIYVRWIKPSLQDFDTLINPGPYQLDLYHSTDSNFTNPQLVFQTTSDHFLSLKDTFYTDNLLNTEGNTYYYRIGLSSNGTFMDYGPHASSIRLSAIGTDRKVLLNWSHDTPWNEDSTLIYRRKANSLAYELIAQIDSGQYTDNQVTNEVEYQYFIQTKGSYIITNLDSLINHSQSIFVTPVDSIAPIAPTLEISNHCTNQANSAWDADRYSNRLDWKNPNGQDDIIGYEIYQKELRSDSLALSLVIDDPTTLHYIFDSLFNSVAACYAVKAFDSNYTNISELSNIVCIDNCPKYELPNVFSPNGDGQNDLYIPFKNMRFIESVDLKIYNRWGDLIFETTDKEIEWDGTHPETGKAFGEGVYYYTCIIFERRIDGILESTEPLSGYLHLFK